MKTFTTAEEIRDDKGNKIICGYRILEKCIGEGAYAKVHLVEDIKTKEKYAMKVMSRMYLKKKRIMSMSPEGLPSMSNMLVKCMREISFLDNMSHEGICTLHAVVDDPEYDSVCMIIDYAMKGQIMHWNGKKHRYESKWLPMSTEGGINIDIARYIFKSLIDSIEYLHHNKHIIHRDLKPDNILVCENNKIKLIDFGVSAQLDDDDIKGMRMDSEGTHYFYSPEACSGDEYSGYEADIWSLGVVLYIMACGELPFYVKNAPEQSQIVLDVILEGKVTFPEKANSLDKSWKDLIIRMLHVDRNERLVDISEIKKNPFVCVDVDIDNLFAKLSL